MKRTVHAFDFLEQSATLADSHVFVLFGDDRFLQLLVRRELLQALSGAGEEPDVSLIDGDATSWAEVNDSLRTVSLFNQVSGRIVVMESADGFVRKYRSELESSVTKPFGSGGRLALEVSTWPSNTKLYKSVSKSGCQIHCGDAQTKRGRSKARDSHRICKWVVARAKEQHGVRLTQACARELLEMVQWNLGQSDQELAKLSLLKGSQPITNDDIQEVVGGWRAQSIWQIVDAAASGNAKEALEHLSKLLQSGEHPLALFGQLSWSLRRYGRVWEILSRQGRAGRRPDLSIALAEAGFRQWNDELSLADANLKQLGRGRVKQIYRWLLETDLALKGTHSDPKRARLALELLLTRMSDQLKTASMA